MKRKPFKRRDSRKPSRRTIVLSIALALLTGLTMLLVAPGAFAREEVVTTITTGTQPYEVDVNATTNKTYVAGGESRKVSVINGTNDTLTKTISLGRDAQALAVNPATNKVYVANVAQNSVTVINGATDSLMGSPISVGSSPNSVDVNPVTNKVYVANVNSSSVTVINGATDTVIGMPIEVGPSPGAVAVNPVTNKIYVADSTDGTIKVIDGAADAVVKTVSAGGVLTALGINTITNKVYVVDHDGGDVLVLDGSADTLTGTEITVGTIPTGIGIDSTTNKIYVTNYDSNSLSVIDGGTNVVTRTIGVHQPTDVEANPATGKAYVADFEDSDGSVSVIADFAKAGPTFYFAEGTTRPDFASYLTIQNPGDVVAYAVITYMRGDATTSIQELNIGPHSRSTVAVADVLGSGDDPSFDFSAKVESYGQSLVVERPMYFNYKGVWTGGHDVVGATAPGTSFYFAEGTTRPGFDPYVCVQNPGTASASVTFTYMRGNGTTTTQYANVPPSARATVHPADVLGTGDDAAHDFSCRVTSANPIVAERPMYFSYKGVWTGGSDVAGATAPAANWYFAEGTTRPGFDPYLTLQNPGASSADVTVTYMKGNGTTKSQALNVPANSRATVHPSDALGVGDDAAHDFSCSVASTNGVPIVAERPMYFDYKGWSGGSDVLGCTAPAQAFYFAEGTCRPNFDPYLTIQNPGGTEAVLTVTYMRGDGTTDVQDVTVAASSRFTVHPADVLGVADDASHDFSLVVQSTNGQNIIVERPMYFNYKGWTGGSDVVGFTP